MEAAPVLDVDTLVTWGSVGGGAGQLAEMPWFRTQLLCSCPQLNTWYEGVGPQKRLPAEQWDRQ